MMNPLKEARLALNLTQSQLATAANLTPNALIKYEQGLYPEPSVKIMEALRFFDDSLTEDHLRREYSFWRYQKVMGARVVFQHNRNIRGLKPTGGVNPFICWRTHHLHISSRLSFCKLLVLHPAVVQKYEEGQMRDMPASIKETLSLVGIFDDSIDYLELLGRSYYDRIHHNGSPNYSDDIAVLAD